MFRIESCLPQPSTTIRAHHLLRVEETLLALRGTTPIEELVERRIREAKGHVQGGHARDILGETQEDEVRFREGVAAHYAQLRRLPNNSSVLINSAPDGFCQATCIGRHCTRWLGDEDADVEDLNILRIILRQQGRKQGKTWEVFKYPQYMYDFGGVGLSTPTVPEPLVVERSAIIVRTGILRRSL
jgi:hypothetical protein